MNLSSSNVDEYVGYDSTLSMKLYCDNHTTMYLASNPIFHDETERLSFYHGKVQTKMIITSSVNSNNKLIYC